MLASWKDKLLEVVEPEILMWDEDSLSKHSTDYHYFSPILHEELKAYKAECIASPNNDIELDAIIQFAVANRVPLTLRGGGTGNYGQCVPLTGGIVLNMSNMNRIMEIGDGYMVAQAGARMGKMEDAARMNGQELMMFPSTYKTASIGGFLAGGFGGIGSISWGTIKDGVVQGLTIKTIEHPSRTFEVSGEDIQPYMHTYGTIGIITEVRISLVPKVEWVQYAVSFDDWEVAARFALDTAENLFIVKRLVSFHDSPVTQYFKSLKLSADKPVVLLEIGANSEYILEMLVRERNGYVELKIEAGQYHKGIGVSDFSWNHTTLWAIKADPRITYLQTAYDRDSFIEQLQAVKASHPEVMTNLEMAKLDGNVWITGLPLLVYRGKEHLYEVMDQMRNCGVEVHDPHVVHLEDGGRAYAHHKLWDIKKSNDPLELLNQLKLSPGEANVS